MFACDRCPDKVQGSRRIETGYASIYDQPHNRVDWALCDDCFASLWRWSGMERPPRITEVPPPTKKQKRCCK